MNKKAEAFKEYLDAKKITCFSVDAIDGDKLNTVVFRSNIACEGQQLPTLVILDSSIYALIRVLVAPKALKEENEIALTKKINELNRTYKAFKLYLDNEGSVVLDCCLLVGNNSRLDGDLVYTMFDMLIKSLGRNYKDIMSIIWR